VVTMEIRKIPIIPPVPLIDTNINDREVQAKDLLQFQTVQQAEALDSTALSFREVTIQKLEETRQDEKPEVFNS